MKCSRCQHENEAGAKFCEECAAPLVARACAKCGRPLSSTAKFCPECAHPTRPSAAPPLAQRFDSPDSYTPKHLAEKVLTSRSALEGERKQVTVLFADLKGSMELLAHRDPEEARKLLDPVLERMMEAVHRYEGTVNQVMGDGIMALFGAPLAHEDHAVRACYAALRMQDTVKQYAEDLRRREGLPIQIRVGLNSGEVVVRSIGSDLHMDYTAVGQTTHLAARMEQLAVPGSILLPAETLSLAEGYVQVTPLGPMTIKGLPAPLEVYELVGAATVRSRLQASAARGLTRFVGRDAELDQLRHALGRAGGGRGQLVAVVGDPGVGKSRLFWEFTHSHRLDGWLLVESSSVSYGKATAFLPLLDLLRAYFQLEPRDDARKIREKVTGKLLSLDRALEPALPALLWLLDVPVEDPLWQRLDPPQRRQQALDGVKRLLLRESQVQPLLVVFEDLHWIDAETQALLDILVESLPTARVLLLVNYRPEYQHRWSGKTYYRQLRIDPLPPESAETLLEALLGTNPGLQPLKRLLIEQTEGNPFFLEESVRTLVETKTLAGERGAYRLARASQTLQIPATAQAILAARIDRLAPEDKQLLQAASVIGKDVPFTLLQAIVDGPEEALRRGLATLQAAEFLYEARLFPDLEYTFKHALTHDVAYGSLLQERRRALHARIVETIEALDPDRLAEHVEPLADHALRGEVWAKALPYLRQAGAKAFARSANREAVGYFERALMVLTHLPEIGDTLEQAVDVRLALRNALFPLGDLESGLGHLRDAERLARQLGDQRRLGWIAAYMSEHARQTGHAADSLRLAESAQAIAESLADLPLRVAANHYRGTAYFTAGEYRRGDEFFARVLQLLDGDRFRERCGTAGFPAVMARVFWAWALAERGEFDQGIDHAQEGVRLAETLDHPYSRLFALLAIGVLHGVRGDLHQAISFTERALALARDWNLTQPGSIVTDQLGYLYALSGRTAEAVPLLQEALATMEAMAIAQWRSPLIVHLGEAHLLANQPDEALEVARQGLALASERGHRAIQARALRLLGEIASRLDPPDAQQAETHYRQALALADELGIRPLVAHCHFGLGMLNHRVGEPGRARGHLTTAATMYREMGMNFWLKKTEAPMGPAHTNSP
jgi:class 3 adenylate cyclase/tetratricopeptide (TPR) repeat protein